MKHIFIPAPATGGTATLEWFVSCGASGDTENLYSAFGEATNVGGSTATGSVLLTVEYDTLGVMGTFGPFPLVVPPSPPATAFGFYTDPVPITSDVEYRLILNITWDGGPPVTLTSAWNEICHPG